MFVSDSPFSSVSGTSMTLPNGKEICRLKYGTPTCARRNTITTALLDRPTGSCISLATVAEKVFVPFRRIVELLTATQLLELKPGRPPKETRPANWFVVGRRADPDSL